MNEGTATKKLPSEGELIVFRSQGEKAETSRDTKGVTVLPIAEARHYDVEAPIANHVYVAHPSNPRKLYLFAQYDEQLLVDVFNEGLRIVQSLGASRVESFTNKSSSSESTGKLKSMLPTGVMPVVTAQTNFEKSHDWEVCFTATGKGSAPVDPRPLRYPTYPGFDATCDAVIKNGASKTQLTIQQESKFLLNGEIAATLKSAGFKLGAATQNARQTVYVIRAEFPSLSEPGSRGILSRGRAT